MKFSKALEMLKRGKEVRRSEWPAGKVIRRLDPVDDNGISKGETMLAEVNSIADRFSLKYEPTVKDMFANDWEEPGLLLVRDVELSTAYDGEPSTIKVELNCMAGLGHGDTNTKKIAKIIDKSLRDAVSCGDLKLQPF